jgi:hypothetical protein
MSTLNQYILAGVLALAAGTFGYVVMRDPAPPAPVCQLTQDGSTCMGGECHGELICCDKATGGCFCADSEHGADCPSGSVKPPQAAESPEAGTTGEKISPAPDSGDGDGDPTTGDGDGEPAAKLDLP